MRKINFSLITIFAAVLFAGTANSQSASPSPTPTTAVGIVKEGRFVDLKDAVIEESGKKVLTIDKNEAVELSRESNVTLKSSNENSVKILDNKYLVGITPGTETEILIEKAGVSAKILNVDRLFVKVLDVDASRQVVAQSTFLPFKTVKDNFGKKFAQTYFVIQVDIRNEKLDKQFIVQTIDVIIDPNQCRNGPEIYRDFDVNQCLSIFNKYFRFPNAQQPIRREEVIAAGKADLGRSNRNIAFRALAFSASVGSILGGFNGLLGRDAVKGVGILGTTFTEAAKALIPDTSDEKLENLRNALPTEDVIIKSKESKTFNIFIPTERVFWQESWEKYIEPAKNSDYDTYQLKVILDLFLLSSATGVLVDNEAPKVQVKSDDSVDKLKDKFNLKVNRFAVAADASAQIDQILKNFGTSLNNAETRRKIINALKALNNKHDAKTVRLNKKITFDENSEETKSLYEKLDDATVEIFTNNEADTESLTRGEKTKALEKINNEVLQALQLP